MEVGSQATPFEHRSFGEEQRLCQRYAIVYSKNGQPNMGQKAIGTGASTNSSGAYQAFIFPQVTMRAVPTLTVGGSVSDYEILKYETGFVDLIVERKDLAEMYSEVNQWCEFKHEIIL